MTTREELDGLPAFTGITTYRDHLGRFEFRHPAGWIPSELDNDLDGIMVRPLEEDENTYFAVWVSSLPEGVVADDLPELKKGFDDGLTQLPDVQVESTKDTTYGNIVKLERVLTFTEDGSTRKRRIWGMYVDTFQVVVVWQGSSVEEYDYWYPMANYCFSMFKIPDELWFRTDPEVNTAIEPG
jgi:hypothetical protein